MLVNFRLGASLLAATILVGTSGARAEPNPYCGGPAQ